MSGIEAAHLGDGLVDGVVGRQGRPGRGLKIRPVHIDDEAAKGWEKLGRRRAVAIEQTCEDRLEIRWLRA